MESSKNKKEKKQSEAKQTKIVKSKENKNNKNKVVKNKKIQSSNETITKGLIVQLISLMILIVLVIWALFNRNVLPYADFVAALTFFIIAFNKKGQNKIIPIGCIIGGILFIAMAIWSLING